MSVKTLLGQASYDPFRRALLQRLANALAVARMLADEDTPDHLLGCWPCCWVEFEMPGERNPAIHRICADNCPHWHQTEVFLT